MSERLKRAFEFALLFPIFPSLLKFSPETKHKIAENANYRCQECGIKPREGEAHHELPQSFGGSDREENGVYLCGEKDRDDHEKYDRKVLDQGIMFNGNSISEATPEMIKSRTKWEKACSKFKL